MKAKGTGWRRWKSRIMVVLAILCVIIAVIPLASILITTVVRGLPAVTSPGFFTENPSTVPCTPAPNVTCSLGGLQNAIVGTLVMVGLASLIALPVGLLAGIYMSEYGGRRSADALRFIVEVMTGIPSIVVGVFIVALIIIVANGGWVSPQLEQSALGGALALAVLMVPIVARTTDEALRLVPTATREAALALGIPRYRAILRIVLSTGRAAVVTGGLLGLARAAGETAPLLIAVGFTQFSFSGLEHQSSSLPTAIYNYGFLELGFQNYNTLGWGAALVLIVLMLGINVGARFLFWSRARKMGVDIV